MIPVRTKKKTHAKARALSGNRMNGKIVAQQIRTDLEKRAFANSTSPSDSPLRFRLKSVLPLPIILPLLYRDNARVSINLPTFYSNITFPFRPTNRRFCKGYPLTFSGGLHTVKTKTFTIATVKKTRGYFDNDHNHDHRRKR